MKPLLDYLRQARNRIVVRREVLVEIYDPSYGLQNPRSEEIEIIDFDLLLNEIDKFHREFEKEYQS